MSRLTYLAAAFFLACSSPASRAADPPPDTQVLAAILRDQLLKNIPTPLVETKHDWDKQKEVTVGMKFRKTGRLRWEAEPQRAMRNDGHWHKVTVVVKDPDRSLALGVKDLKSPEEGKVTFVAMVGADVDLKFEQQLWKSGTRLYSGETRGRCRAAVALTCEATSKLERKPGAFLPTAVLRLRVTEAQLFYEKLVVEHTLGVGGDAAKIIGETAHKLISRIKPSLERDLLAKANAAIVKAGDTREIRIEFEKLLAGKSK